MAPPPAPPTEFDRLGALLACDVLGSVREEVFDRLVALAGRLLDVPTAVVNLVAADRQWAKAAIGMEHGDEVAREHSFCAWAILTPKEVMVVPDALTDPRFVGNPLVQAGLRFYAGAPLLSADGHAIGTLCVADTRPRHLSGEDVTALETLAAAAAAHLDARRRAKTSARVASQLAAVLAHAPDAFVSVDSDGKIVEWNRQAERLLGWSREEALGRDLAALIVPEELRDTRQAGLQRMLTGEAPRLLGRPVDVTARRRDGSAVDVEVSIAPGTFDEDSRVNAFLRDVSERKAADREHAAEAAALRSLAELQQRLARGTEATTVWHDVCAGAVAQVEASAAVLWLVQPDFSARAVAVCNRDELIDARLDLDRGSLVADVVRLGTRVFVADFEDEFRADPQLLRRSQAVSAGFLPVAVGNQVVGVLAVLFDARRETLSLSEAQRLAAICTEAAVAVERVGLIEQLRHLSHHDQLTGVGNRRLLDHALPRELDRARPGEVPLTVVLLDLDHFKAYNDQHGHQGGDRLLREAAAAWQEALRSTDVLARYGGEEFAVVLPACTASDADALVARLRELVPYGQTASAGIAEWNRTEGPDALLFRADTALYVAKARGRNRSWVSEPAPSTG